MLWWIGRVNSPVPTDQHEPVEVSILVVVDWSRQPMVVELHRQFGGVSILVVVDWSRQPESATFAFPNLVRFQSLLWWIGRVNFLAARRTIAYYRVSILVVVDWSRQLGDRELPPRRGVPILVVVDRSRQPRWPTKRHATDKCFNPCCGGLVASTESLGTHGFRGRSVSILVVVDWSRQRGRPSPKSRSRSQFQSLLWWIGRVNIEQSAWCRGYTRCFNPCCGGLVASTAVATSLRAILDRVSILVVVDRSRQPGSRSREPSVKSGFNPCCGGSVASTYGAYICHQAAT